jgi:hypothetical protein
VADPGTAYHPLETLDERARILAELSVIAAHAYPGAEAELATLLDDLRHGRPVKI